MRAMLKGRRGQIPRLHPCDLKLGIRGSPFAYESEVKAVLKITTQTHATRIIFELEGRLVGAWVQELEGCWRKAASSERLVRVMVCAVTFIDDKGKALFGRDASAWS